jgi:xanthosine utilization system XapX-like protein
VVFPVPAEPAIVLIGFVNILLQISICPSIAFSYSSGAFWAKLLPD